MEAFAKILSFDAIPAQPDRRSVLTRLGYHKVLTEVDKFTQQKLDRGLKEGSWYCRPKGAAGRFVITEHRENLVRIETGSVFESKQLARFLGNCDELVLLAATLGKEITERIGMEMEKGDAAYGVILDAVASETADAGLDWIMEFLNKILRREGKKLTRRRYSPGYGDLSLIYQKTVFDLLDLGKLGLDLTEKYMLVPEKSVIAIAGIERIGVNE